MKKLIAGIAVGIAVLGLSGGKEAKADYDTLSGVADIIAATGTLVNPGYSETVYYNPSPCYAPARVVYYDNGYYPSYYGGYGYRNYRHYNNYYYPRHHYRCY